MKRTGTLMIMRMTNFEGCGSTPFLMTRTRSNGTIGGVFLGLQTLAHTLSHFCRTKPGFSAVFRPIFGPIKQESPPGNQLQEGFFVCGGDARTRTADLHDVNVTI